jgi:hypothetical protein
MTAARRETRLLELAAKWRADADRSRLLQGLVCADELEAALREAEPPQECGNFTPLKDGLRAPSIADHYGHGWRAGRNAQMSAGENARGGEALGRVPPATITDVLKLPRVWSHRAERPSGPAEQFIAVTDIEALQVASARQESETP